MRRAPAITPQVVRWAHVPGARPQFGLTPVLLTLVLVPGTAYYFVPDLEYTAVFILTGIALALVAGLEFYRTQLRR